MSDVNSCIPDDLWFDILQRLPVKSLGKCRCVCKSWYSLVTSPSFMAAHLKHYTLNDSNSLLLYKRRCESSNSGQYYERCEFYRDSTHFNEGITNTRLHTSTIPFMLPDEKPCHYIQLIGSINGLLCLSPNFHPGSTERILIWNPLLNKSIMLQESLPDEKIIVFGFGYNCRNNDHVVLKLSRSRTLTTRLVEIYSVQERAWRTISADSLLCKSKYSSLSSQCFFNGFIHWLVEETEEDSGHILLRWFLMYNVAEETFDRMELPPLTPLNEVMGEEYGIFEYQRKLALSRFLYSHSDPYDSRSYEVWVHEGINRWCKILNGCVPDCHMCPIQYLGVNEELVGFYNKNTFELVSYDAKTKQTKGVGLYVSHSTRFTAYSQSLALLDHNTDTFTAEQLQRMPPKISEDDFFCHKPVFKRRKNIEQVS